MKKIIVCVLVFVAAFQVYAQQGYQSGLRVNYSPVDYGSKLDELSIGYDYKINHWLGAQLAFHTVLPYTIVKTELSTPFPQLIAYDYRNYSIMGGLQAYLFGFVKNKFQTHLGVNGGMINDWYNGQDGTILDNNRSGRFGVRAEEAIVVSNKLQLLLGYQYDYITKSEKDYQGVILGLKFTL